MTTQTIKDLNHYVMKSDISEDHVNVLSALFRSLCKANQQGVLFDHTGDDPNIMTLDIDQVRDIMRMQAGKLITNMEILNALSDLHTPRLLPESVKISREGNDGYRIMPVRLDYSQPESPDNDKSDADSCSKMSTEDELDKCDASRRWIDHAMKLEKQNAALQKRVDNQQQTIERLRSSGKAEISRLKEQHALDQTTIANLRSVITELSEVLYEVDADARISITSSDVLELMQSNCDTADTPF